MRTRALAVGLACITSLTFGVASAAAATRCVGSAPGCHHTIQAALDAAHDGDAIKVASGTFAGGVEITKSVGLSGAGAHATTIRGGGPVVTVGTQDAASEPTVSIAGVRITGGRTSTGPGGDTVFAAGGGVYVPPGAEGRPGASVTIRDSAVSGNRAAPATDFTPEPGQFPDGPTCPDGPCPYAEGDGGGIASWGNLKLFNTIVSDNEAGGPIASDAKGGGIYSAVGSLTVAASKLAHNRAVVAAPNGRFAEGGGALVETDAAAATIRDTLIAGNAAELTSHLPAFVGDSLIDVQSHAGGVLIASHVPATIERTVLAGNSASAHNPAGEPVGYDSALQVLDTPITIRDTLITGNRASAVVQTSADVGPAGGAVELDGGGTLTRVQIVGNPSSVTAADGDAAVAGAFGVFDFEGSPDLARVSDSVISANPAVARSSTGSATVHGAGVYNNSLLELRRVSITHNVGTANAASGAAEGAGIWNGAELSGPPVELTLTDALITRNRLAGSAGIERHGAGLFTAFPVTRTRTRIAGNRPDQCFGCGAASVHIARNAAGAARTAPPWTAALHGARPWGRFERADRAGE